VKSKEPAGGVTPMIQKGRDRVEGIKVALHWGEKRRKRGDLHNWRGSSQSLKASLRGWEVVSTAERERELYLE